MSFCQYCGEKNPDTSKFCFRCGKPLGAFVPANQPPAPMQNNNPMANPDATQRVQMPYNEPVNQPFVPEQTNDPFAEPAFVQNAPEQTNEFFAEPAFQQFDQGQMNMPYSEPAFQQFNQGQMNVPYNDLPLQQPKKKSKAPIIAVCAIVVILIAVAAVLILTHTICLFHEFSEPTCTEPAVCTYCDKEGDDALGHDWKDANCTEAKTCETCGEVEGEALGHTWIDPTCTVAMTCTVCGATDGEALGHDYIGGSCTEASMCSRCYEMGSAAPGHTEGSWTAVTEATLVSTGEEELCCANCGVLLDQRVSAKKDAQVKADSFNFGHYEFAQWVEETQNIIVDYDYEVDYEDGFITYYIETLDYDEGFMMMETNAAGEVVTVLFYFEDGSLAGALAVLVASEIDPGFSQDGAIEAFDTYNYDSYSDAGMNIVFTSNEGYVFATPSPDGTGSTGI